MQLPIQIKTGIVSAYVSSKIKQFFAYYNIQHIMVYHTILQDKEADLIPH